MWSVCICQPQRMSPRLMVSIILLELYEDSHFWFWYMYISMYVFKYMYIRKCYPKIYKGVSPTKFFISRIYFNNKAQLALLKNIGLYCSSCIDSSTVFQFKFDLSKNWSIILPSLTKTLGDINVKKVQDAAVFRLDQVKFPIAIIIPFISIKWYTRCVQKVFRFFFVLTL